MPDIDTAAATTFMTTHIVPWTIKIVGVLFALFIAWGFANWARAKALRGLEKRKLDLTLSRFCANMVRYLILIGAVLGCLGVFGIETTSFAAVIGGGALAVGLAFQGTLSNFAAGAMLLIFRPFKVGDYVTVAGVSGTVDEIELFTVKIITADNRVFIVPNGSIFGAVIENASAMPTRRVDVKITTGIAADLEQTRATLTKAIGQVPHILPDPAVAVALTGLAPTTVDWAVRVWTKSDNYFAVHEALLQTLKVELQTAQIVPAPVIVPHMNIHVDRLDK